MAWVTAEDTSSSSQNRQPFSQRFSSVKGDGERTNDMFVYGEPDCQQHIIYFGGDVQDYPENMEGISQKYLAWNTEKTAALLHNKFPQSLIFAIRPKEKRHGTISVYSNFVEADGPFGLIHIPEKKAIKHLALLHKCACGMVAKELEEQRGHSSTTDSPCSSKEHTDGVSIGIVGFSKGCVILNQLVFELLPPELQSIQDRDASAFLHKIKALYWLDGGHSGGDTDIPNGQAYITEPHRVSWLVNLGCSIHVHATPYQVHDLTRPWLGKQYRQFCKLLRQVHVSFHGAVHFEKEPGSLKNHFRILDVF